MVPNNRIRGFWFNSSNLDLPTDYPGMILLPARQATPSPEEIRFHARLHERLTAVRRPRPGLWSRIWRFIWGD